MRALLLATVLLATAPACADRQQFIAADRIGRLVTEGRIEVPGGAVRYRVVGAGGGTPLLLVPAGPGLPGDYLAPLEALADDRPVIFYDQLGSGRSDHPTDPALWRTERFVEELSAVRTALRLDRVILFGHGWGAAVATAHALAHAAGVKALVLASPLLSGPRWNADAEQLRRALPPDVDAVLRRHEAAGTTGSAEYQAASEEFRRRFVCTVVPRPRELEQALAGFGHEPHRALWGPSDLHVTGPLGALDLTPRLGDVRVPTLFTVGRFDAATPETIASFQALVPGSRGAVFEHSAHMAMLEERDAYVAALRRFLREVDAR
jgi:proline iminopeptidase